MLSAALTCSWESRGKSEQSCSAPTESEEGPTQQPDREDGNYTPTRGKNPEPALLLPLPSAPLARPPATMRADFALVLTAVLLLDAFWVRLRSATVPFSPRRVASARRVLLDLQASEEQAE